MHSDEDYEDEDHPRARRRSFDETAGDDDEYEDEDMSTRPPRVRFDEDAGMDDEEKDSRSKYKELARKIERGVITPQAAGVGGEGPSSRGMTMGGKHFFSDLVLIRISSWSGFQVPLFLRHRR